MSNNATTRRRIKLSRYMLKAMGMSLALTLGSASALPAAEFEWRMDTGLAENRIESEMFKRFVERVSEKSNGRLEIKLFFGNSLGLQPVDVVRSLKSGAVEASAVGAAFLSRDAPDLALAAVQGIVLEPEENLVIMDPLIEIYEAQLEEWSIKPVGWTANYTYQISVLCGDEPINTLGGLQGKKVRVFTKDQADTMNRLGIAAQIIGQNDLYLALQSGVVDCALYTISLMKSVSVQEVVDYGAPLYSMTTIPFGIGVNMEAWNGLPEDLQEIVIEAGDWMEEESKQYVLDDTAEMAARKEFTAAGELEVLEPFSSEDKQKFYDAASVAWEKAAQEVGRKAPEYRGKVLRALEEARQ